MLAGNRLRQRAGEDDAAQQHEVVVRVTLRRRFCFVLQLTRLGQAEMLISFRHLMFRIPTSCDAAFKAVLSHISDQWLRELSARVEAWQVNQVSQQGQVVHGGLSANHASLNPDGLLDSEITFLANHLGLDFQQLRRPPVGLEDPDPESNPLASDGQESVLFCGHQQKHSSRILATYGGRVIINSRFDLTYDGLAESLEKSLSAVRYLRGVEPKRSGGSSDANGSSGEGST